MRQIIILLLITSCAQLSTRPQVNLQELYQNHWEWTLEQAPEWATFEGRTETNDRWSDQSLEAIEYRHQYYRDLLQILKEIDSSHLVGQDLVDFTIFKNEILLRVESQRFPSHLIVVTQLRGPHTMLGRLFAAMPKNNQRDLENILARLETLPNLVEQYKAHMKKGLEKSITPPRAILGGVAQQFMAITESNTKKNPLSRSLYEISGSIDEQMASDYRERVDQLLENHVLPSLKAWKRFVLEDYIPKTREETAWTTLPDGQAWYDYLVRMHTTTELTPQEIHDIGLNEVARLHGLKRELISSTGHRGALEDYKQDLLTNPKYFFETEEELVHAYQALAKRIDADVAQLFRTLPRTPYGVKKMEPHIAASSPAALYFGGNLNVGRSGTFYVNTSNLQSRPKWEMEALTLHEAVPGHHLQIALAQEMEGVPEFRRRGRYTAFVEGWGLYAEGLGYELNLYQDAPSEFGRLSFEMWRAVRLVVDTGLHALGWSREDAIDYFKKNSGRPHSEAIIEVDRYIIWPGQALAYKIGELKIWELRQKAESVLGEDFDVREFHDEILRHGAIPLSIMEDNINQWLRDKDRP